MRMSCDSLHHTLDDVLSMQKIEEEAFAIEPSYFDPVQMIDTLYQRYSQQVY